MKKAWQKHKPDYLFFRGYSLVQYLVVYSIVRSYVDSITQLCVYTILTDKP